MLNKNMLHCHQLTVNLRFTLTGCPWPVNCELTIINHSWIKNGRRFVDIVW